VSNTARIAAVAEALLFVADSRPDRFDTALPSGPPDGRMIGPPIVEQTHRLLSREAI
jgi:hypothetical protein